MDPETGLTESDAKRHMIAEMQADHGETIAAYPLLRWEFGLLYRDMDELPMYRFRPWLRSIERVVRDIERGGSPKPCWACGRRHEGVVCPWEAG